MKTIIITSSPQITSATTFFNELGKAFHKEGFRVIIIFDKKNIRNDNPNGLIYKIWPSKRPTKLKDFIFFRNLVKEYKPLYIISSFGAVNISLIGGFLFGIKNRIAWFRTTSKQLRMDSHNSVLKDYFLRLRKSFIINLFASEVHTNSYNTANDLKHYLYIKNKKIKVIYFLLEDFTSKYSKKKEPIISFVGRFTLSKGQEIMIKAIPYVLSKNPNYRFYFIGDGVAKQRQIELAKRLKVEKSCVFTGSISQSKVYAILAKSKLHVSASEDEAFGMVNLEAIAFKTPILAHEVGGIPEILDGGINGFFYKCQDSIELSSKINEIIDNPNLYENLQNGAIKIFNDKFLMNESNLNKRIDLILKK